MFGQNKKPGGIFYFIANNKLADYGLRRRKKAEVYSNYRPYRDDDSGLNRDLIAAKYYHNICVTIISLYWTQEGDIAERVRVRLSSDRDKYLPKSHSLTITKMSTCNIIIEIPLEN